MTEKPGDVGEFDLIARLLRRGRAGGDGVVLGVGDDCAVLEGGGDELLLMTTDLMTEGVHFLRASDPLDLGDKLMSVNLSDVAAMGGRPAHAVLAMAVPDDVEVGYLERVYAGLFARAERHGVSLVGGDTTASHGPLTLSLTLTGRVASDRVLRRDGASAGDRILVSGTIGDSAAGLGLLLGRVEGRDLPDDVRIPPGQVTMTIRPEHVQSGVDGNPAPETSNTCTGQMIECIYVGTHTRCRLQAGEYQIEATSGTDSPVAFGEGGEVRMHFPPDRIWLLQK